VDARRAAPLFWLQDNQPDWASEDGLLTDRPADRREASAQKESRIWHLLEVDWPVADRPARVVKTVRVQDASRVAVRKDNGPPIREKQPAPIVSISFYATKGSLGRLHEPVGGTPTKVVQAKAASANRPHYPPAVEVHPVVALIAPRHPALRNRWRAGWSAPRSGAAVH